MKQWIIDLPMRPKDWFDEMNFALTEGDSNPDLIMSVIEDCVSSRLAKGLVLGSAGALAIGAAIQAVMAIRKKRRSKKTEEA